ncbi:MAG: MFS transporter [Tepidiformaceae bacterium]
MAALRQRSFQLYSVSRVFFAVASTLLTAAIAWQVYASSGSALDLGLLGLARCLPSLGLGLVGGALADRYDRKRIAIAGQAAVLMCAIVLFAFTSQGKPNEPLIYGMVLLVAVASAFEWPARQALLVSVVTPETLQNAITVSSTVQQLGFVTGPALAGGLIALSGVGLAYFALCILVAGSILSLVTLRPRPMDGPKRAVSVEAIKEGLSFVYHRQVLLGAMTLDLFAVIFGGATALLPIYAKDILHAGPVGYGLLSGSLDFGALMMSIALVALPPVKRPGRALMAAVLGFGLGTVVFGLSRNFALSLVAYMLIGIADQVSVVMRTTTVQLATPDELRGRVSSVNSLFVGASNQVGQMESGFVAAATSATFAVVSGGIGALAALGVIGLSMPELRRYHTDSAIAFSKVPTTAELVLEAVEEEESSAAAGG